MTKIVNGRVVTTRAVSPEAYEHVTRALLYEEEERWKEAADELQRALPFDPEAAEVRAQLAELFIRQDRLDDAAEQIARSLQIAETVEGYLARAHLAQAYDDEAHHAQEIPALREAARLALAGEDAESIELTHLELSEAQVVSLDLAGAMDTARRLVDAVPETLRGRTQLAVVGWATGAFDQAAAALAAAIEIEPNDVEARILLAELQVATNKIDAAKDGFRAAIDRAESPMAVADAFAGWLILRGDVAEAQDLADRLVADAGDADTLAVASAFERTVKRPDRAVALAERASKLGLPAGRRALLLGAAALAKDDQAGAAAAYMSIDKREPSFFEARLRAADVLREQGKVDEAERALNDARAAGLPGGHAGAGGGAPHRAGGRPQPGRREARRRRTRGAATGRGDRQGRRRARRLAPDPGARGRRRTARRLAARHRARRAAARAQAAQRGGAELRRLRRRRSQSRHGAHAPARSGRRRAVAGVGRDHRQPRLDVLHAGDLARADVYLEQAARLEPGDPEVLEHLGDLYAKRQERDRALATYRRALGFKPNDRVARELGIASAPWKRRARPADERSPRRFSLAPRSGERVGERGPRSRGAGRRRSRRRVLRARAADRDAPVSGAGGRRADRGAVGAAGGGAGHERARPRDQLAGRRARAGDGEHAGRARRPPALRGRDQLAGDGRGARDRRDGVLALRRAQERALARAGLPGQRRVDDPHPARSRGRRGGAARRRAHARTPIDPATASVGWDARRGADVLAIPAREGGTLQFLFHGDGAARTLVAIDRIGTNGAPMWRTAYEDHEAVGAVRLPGIIRFAEQNSSFDDGVEIKFKDRSINATPPADAFTLPPPAGATIVDVGCGAGPS